MTSAKTTIEKQSATIEKTSGQINPFTVQLDIGFIHPPTAVNWAFAMPYSMINQTIKAP